MSKKEFVYVKFWENDGSGVIRVSFHKFKSWVEVQPWALMQSHSSDGEQGYRRATQNEYVNGRMNNPIDRGSQAWLSGVGCFLAL